MPKVWNKRDPNCPKDAVYVGRPSRWGNPYSIGKHGTREEVVLKYRHFIENDLDHPADLELLRGRDLVCWCHTWDGQGDNPMYCHADILLELANLGEEK